MPIDKNIIKALPLDRPYTIAEAYLSFACDLNNGAHWTISGYSKLWGWNRNKVRIFVNTLIKGDSYPINMKSGYKQKKDSKRTVKGQEGIRLINMLSDEKDSKRTVKGHYYNTRILDINTRNTYSPFSCSFEKIWNLYPNKVGRKAAERHFKATVKTVVDEQAIMKALENYKADTENKRKNGFDRHWQNGSTWFNNWQDWVEYKPEEDWKVKFLKLQGEKEKRKGEK